MMILASIRWYLLMLAVGLMLSACSDSEIGKPGDAASSALTSRKLVPERKFPRPLIYFSETDPAGDDALQEEFLQDTKLDSAPGLSMAFGANTWSNYTFLVIRGSREASSEFELVSQLFRFIVQHGWHSKKMPGGYHNMNQALFYQSRPLELTCGKYSGYLIELLKKDLGVAVPDKRRIAVFPENGRHVFREVFFHELGKWVMFDCDAGCIPVLNGVPLSMLELSLLSDAEFDAAVSTGLELYGRGPIGGRFGKGPAAKSWADGLLKETRHHFAIDDNWHFMRRSAEEVNDWKERVINPANPKHKKITVTNDPEAFRARFYSGKHQRGYRP